MTKLFQIAREEMLLHLRQYTFYLSLALTVGIFVAAGALPRLRSAAADSPLASLTANSVFNEEETLTVPTGFVDRSGILQQVPPEQEANFIQFDDVETAALHLENDLIDSYYIISADYLETGRVEQISPDPQLVEVSDTAVQSILRYNLIAPNGGENLANRLADPVSFNWKGQPPPAFSFLPPNLETGTLSTAALVAALFAYIINISGFLLLGALQRERNSRVLELLISTTTPTQLIGGKLLGLSALAFIQVGLSLLAGTLVYGGNPDGSGPVAIPGQTLLLALPFIVLGYFAYGSIMVAITTILPNLGESMQLQFVVRLLFLAPFAGVIFILPNADSSTSGWLTLLPVSSPLLMPFRMLITAVPTWQVAASLLILAGWTYFLFWLSTRLFRLQTLMTGRLPSLRVLGDVLFSER